LLFHGDLVLVAKMVLVDALRLCDEPGNEEAVEGILAKLFRAPRVSVQAAAEGYAEKFRAWGLASVPALELVAVQDLITAGVPFGHALTLHAAINVQQEMIQTAPVQQAVPLQQRNVRAAAVTDFPELGDVGYPTHTSWRSWHPQFVAHSRSRIDSLVHEAMRALIKDPSRVSEQWITDLFDTEENRALHNEFINAGTGMPSRLLLQLPVGLVEAENGLAEMAHVASHLEKVSDDAAEVVAEWLSQPPVVTEGRRHLLGETLAEWRRMLAEGG
jgi:hypothetical protein